ncbi:MAG: hypothetical protein ABI759_29855 [Candidatus Solibacter sp.]
MKLKARTAIACLALATTRAFAQSERDRAVRGSYLDTIPAGSRVPVRLDQAIDVTIPSDGRVFTGSVTEDVTGQAGAVIIPRGARAEVLVQNLGEHEGTIDLDSVTFEGRRYMVNAEKYNLSRRTSVGKNERTAKYVGGGAIFGTLLGAIAGGGKGAAIGAVAGGAAGAGAQTLTRGSAVRVPAESVLTFRLDEPFQFSSDPYRDDNGYDENGVHYHNDYYNRRDRR